LMRCLSRLFDSFLFLDSRRCSLLNLFCIFRRYFGGSIFSPLLRVMRDFRPTSTPTGFFGCFVSTTVTGISTGKHAYHLSTSLRMVQVFTVPSIGLCCTIRIEPIFERNSFPVVSLHPFSYCGYVKLS